jgi:hypothetical protein
MEEPSPTFEGQVTSLLEKRVSGENRYIGGVAREQSELLISSAAGRQVSDTAARRRGELIRDY